MTPDVRKGDTLTLFNGDVVTACSRVTLDSSGAEIVSVLSGGFRIPVSVRAIDGIARNGATVWQRGVMLADKPQQLRLFALESEAAHGN